MNLFEEETYEYKSYEITVDLKRWDKTLKEYVPTGKKKTLRTNDASELAQFWQQYGAPAKRRRKRKSKSKNTPKGQEANKILKDVNEKAVEISKKKRNIDNS